MKNTMLRNFFKMLGKYFRLNAVTQGADRFDSHCVRSYHWESLVYRFHLLVTQNSC